jgi:hypothetical protein
MPAVVAVPAAWRRRVAIGWGQTADASWSVRFERCRHGGKKRWLAYAGGFLLRARSECFPLDFTVGSATARIWFGLGRPCPRRLIDTS